MIVYAYVCCLSIYLSINKKDMLRELLSVLFLLLMVSEGYSQEHQTSEKLKEFNWHHLDKLDDSVYGVSVVKAYRELETSNYRNLVTVAVIDGDLDVNHEDLKNRLWSADRSTQRKYKNIKNGWNFLGTKDGAMITKVGTEAFREYKRLRPKFEGREIDDFTKQKDKKDFEYFQQVKKDAKIQGYLNFFPLIELTYEAFRVTDSLLAKHLKNAADLTLSDISNFKVNDSTHQEYIDAALRSSYKYAEDTKWSLIMESQTAEYELAVNRIKSLDDISNPRDSIGDDIRRISDKYYGNATLVDSTSYHGTFVAGLIAAERYNNKGIDGIAENARIMGIRAVPDGDEFDKDIALAIRFAVDQGAKIINMSFGKQYSPKSKWVDKAVKYALKKNVLLVQAAGNDDQNIDSIAIYPRPTSKYKKNAHLIIGASNYNGEKASFSNYGESTVDFFAPGEEIVSTMLDNKYTKANGTSFAAPIVSGVAALVWSQYPKLKAYEVADILRISAERSPVKSLEGKAKIGGIVNAYEALKIADRYGESR